MCKTLPLNWACKITTANKDILSQWAKSQLGYNTFYNHFGIECFVVKKHPSDNSYQYNCGLSEGVYADYFTETSFEDFKLLVLKENMSESKQITLTLDKARSMYGKSTEMDELLLANFTKDELTKKELPKIVINGYSAEFSDNFIKFGCAKIERSIIIAIYQLMSLQEGDTYQYKGITNITFGNGTFTIDQVKEIANYYLKK